MTTAIPTSVRNKGWSIAMVTACIFAGLLSCSSPAARSQQQARDGAPRVRGMGSPILPDTPPERVSEHVYELTGFPNVVFVVGDRGTLVVDTGMGPKNGALVAKDAASLKPGNILYLTTTHFHPEHAAGDGGFPKDTILVRNTIQQKELEADNGGMVKMFSSRGGANADLLKDVEFRKPDITFEKELTIDLGGGVTARLIWAGPAHTQGDELTYVEPDRTLISGDVVQNKTLPSLFGPTATLKSWIRTLQQLQSMVQPAHIVPDHSPAGDGSLLSEDLAFYSHLQSRALELKAHGKSAAEAGQAIVEEVKTQYPGWPLEGVPGLVNHIYSENP